MDVECYEFEANKANNFGFNPFSNRVSMNIETDTIVLKASFGDLSFDSSNRAQSI